jgi:arsenate reductase-like glutaredoxin family protein
VKYIDVLSDAGKLDTMLKYTDGRRKVPIIVDKGEVIIGFNGKA